MLFSVVYTTASAERASKLVEAPAASEAKSLSGVPAGRIISVKPASSGLIAKVLQFKPPIFDQIAVLAAIGSVVSAGNSVEHAFRAELEQRPKFAKILATVPAGAFTSEKLKKLNFDPTVVMLVRAGESAGDLASAVTTAAENLSDRLRVNQQLNKGLKPAMLMLALMTLALFGMPQLFGPVVSQLQAAGGLVVDVNPATTALFGLEWAGNNLWMLGIILPIVLIIFRKPIWQFLRFKPFFRQLDSLDRCKRAVQFLSAYIPLDAAGIGSAEILKNFRDNAPNPLEKELFKRHIDQIMAGKPMSESFDRSRYPDVFINAIRGIEKAPDATVRKNVLMLIRRNLMTLTDITAEKLMVSFNVLKWLMVVLVLGLMVAGAYLPLLTMHGGGSGPAP